MDAIVTLVCTKCGVEQDVSCFSKDKRSRDGIRNTCKSCACKWQAEWTNNNPEKVKNRRAEWYKNNLEKEKSRAAEWRKNNPEKVKSGRAKWEKKNIDKVKAKHAKWAKNNPEKGAAAKHKRRAQIIGNGGAFTVQEWNDLCVKYDNKCLCCGEQGKMSVDHVIPLALGGTNYISNIQPLCVSCNCKKHTKTIDYRK